MELHKFKNINRRKDVQNNSLFDTNHLENRRQKIAREKHRKLIALNMENAVFFRMDFLGH